MPLDPARPFLISPPFGRYLRHPRAYSVLGSYTALARPGRWRHILRTVRPVPGDAGPAWINKVGLRNPGIDALPILREKWDRKHHARIPLPPFKPEQIISLAPIEEGDWRRFAEWLELLGANRTPLIEVNVSCPNIDADPRVLQPPRRVLERMIAVQPDLIIKLPPLAQSVDAALDLYDRGVRYVHLSNTYPTPIGGLSGAPLREINLPLVEELAHSLPSLNIIGGGGILSVEDVISYRSAGARWFSLSTAFFRPRRGWRILNHGAR